MASSNLSVTELLVLTVSARKTNVLSTGYWRNTSSKWGYLIKRASETEVKIILGMIEHPHIKNAQQFKYLHLIPHEPAVKAPNHTCRGLPDDFDSRADTPSIDSGNFVFTVPEINIIKKSCPEEYAFDMILSASKEITLRHYNYNPSDNQSHNDDEADNSVSHKPLPFKELCPEKYRSMLALLRDSGSVNTAFVFTIHSCERKIAIWAHRALLETYPRFQELFDEPRLGGIEPLSDGRSVIVPIEGISLPTFCVFLKYLYTEELNFTIDPSDFLMCDMDHLKPSESLSGVPGVLNKALRECNASQFYASWEVKDKVVWSDLFLVADRFEITKLRQLCLKNLLASVNSHNAMEILFGVGYHYKSEIRDNVMKYISEHLDDVYSVQTQDPFKRFADHEGCHEVMLELLRLSRSK
ncbi:hypothetical protein EDD21DRAFT_379160 [Dissophora ornata]|nr:hypothetical protein EDD21DRAFT_379160 [Dissophora ornata]